MKTTEGLNKSATISAKWGRIYCCFPTVFPLLAGCGLAPDCVSALQDTKLNTRAPRYADTPRDPSHSSVHVMLENLMDLRSLQQTLQSDTPEWIVLELHTKRDNNKTTVCLMLSWTVTRTHTRTCGERRFPTNLK